MCFICITLVFFQFGLKNYSFLGRVDLDDCVLTIQTMKIELVQNFKLTTIMKKRIVIAIGIKVFSLLAMVGAEAKTITGNELEGTMTYGILDEGRNANIGTVRPLFEKQCGPVFERNKSSESLEDSRTSNQ